MEPYYSFEGVKLEEDINDPITLNEIDLEKEQRRQHIFIDINNTLVQPYETEGIYKWMIMNQTNPTTRQKFKEDEINYITFYHECWNLLNKYKYNKDDIKTIYDTYITMMKSYTLNQINSDPKLQGYHNLARCLLSINNFEDHFKHYDATDSSSDRVERVQSRKVLQASQNGSWLLRHSSYNRTLDEPSGSLKKRGIRYYALSYRINDRIENILITHRLGHGWSKSPLGVKTMIWYTNFIDMIESLLEEKGLAFKYFVNGYMNVEINAIQPANKIIAFDFDNTITNRHLVSLYNAFKNNPQDAPFDRKIVSALFQDNGFIQKLKDNYFKGVRYFVVSYGNIDIIINYLKGLGIDNIFSRIYTPSYYDDPNNTGHKLKDYHNVFNQLEGKNKMLQSAQNFIKSDEVIDIPNSKVLLVDDSGKNILKANQAGYDTLHVIGDKGLSLAYKDNIFDDDVINSNQIDSAIATTITNADI